MRLDRDEILIGDLVHDVVFGSGTIEHINEAENKIHVRFGAHNRLFIYNNVGVSNFPERTLYWKEPVGRYVPMKNDKKWEFFCRARDALAKVIWEDNTGAY